jgi:ABC-2 type transport system ATP-binding protein
MNNIAIQLINVSKQYTIHHEKPTLVEKFYKGKNEQFWALKNINLTIKKGERVGIMGPNGSGKTTLLKLIAGITTPTSGTIITSGKVVSLIDLEAGFHPDLTGYQNIFINGMLLGVNKKVIFQKIQSIIDFADIKQFIDAPLFTYSQGMKLRLGFAIAIHADPKILILDEYMGVGDEKFHKKSSSAIQNLYKSNITTIFVSHWYEYLKRNTKKIIRMNNGELV